MNRRKAVKNILGLAVVGGAAFVGFRIFELKKAVNAMRLIDKKTLIADLAEIVIPKTNSVGAKAAQVENFIISVLENCTSNVEQNLFLEGLDDIESYCNQKFNTSFSFCNTSQQISVMAHFEKSEIYDSKILNKINNKFFGVPFFSKLKELTIQGYCNSQLGATESLSYSFIPGHFTACIPLKLNQPSWATK